MTTFKIGSLRGDNKEIFLSCADSEDFQVSIDNDDVDRLVVATLMERLLRVLNDHWNDTEYADMKAETPPDDDNEAYWDSRYDRAEAILDRLKGERDK